MVKVLKKERCCTEFREEFKQTVDAMEEKSTSVVLLNCQEGV